MKWKDSDRAMFGKQEVIINALSKNGKIANIVSAKDMTNEIGDVYVTKLSKVETALEKYHKVTAELADVDRAIDTTLDSLRNLERERRELMELRDRFGNAVILKFCKENGVVI